MSKTSKVFKRIFVSLLLTVVALPLLGGATVSAATNNYGTTVNVIVQNDDVNLSLESVNGEKNNANVYETTQDTATAVFIASGIGDIIITDANSGVIYNKTKTTPEPEKLTVVIPIGNVPGDYGFTLSMTNNNGSTSINFQMVLKAASVPEIPLVPSLPSLPNTGYTKLFGHIVTNKGFSSVVFICLLVVVAAICLALVLVQKKSTAKKRSATHGGKRGSAATKTHKKS
jgi:hypothetical protein